MSAVVKPAPSLALLMQQLGSERIWILARLQPKDGGGIDKVPTNLADGRDSNAQDRSTWLTGPEAAEAAAAWNAQRQDPVIEYGVGLMIADGRWCIDLDHCREGSGWAPRAVAVVNRFPGAYVEVSQSQESLHIMGFCRPDELPLHGTRCKELGAECYSQRRFIYVTGYGANGDARTDLTDQFKLFATQYFPKAEAGDEAQWSDKPVTEWSGPADDAELIRRALRSSSAKGIFGGKAQFRDLWEANADALARSFPPYGSSTWDGSAADQALANHLAFWTGKNPARIGKLMRESKLVRSKWDRVDYFQGTILKACADQKEVYKGAGDEPPSQSEMSITLTMTASPPPVDIANVPPPPTDPWIILSDPDVPMSAARTFIDKYYRAGRRTDAPCEIHHWQSTFMVYNDGVYVELTDDAINSKVWNAFDAATDGTPLKSKQVSEIIKALKAQTYLPENIASPCWLDAPEVELPDLLICQNGAFDLSTGTMHELTPRLFATVCLPVDYDPSAPSPTNWLAFLRSLWPDDQESIDTLQEIFGLLLTPITKFQKLFLLVGPKRSGKGTILRTLRRLLGTDNVTAPTLSTIAEPFGLQCLIGKYAALIGDARIKARGDKMPVVVERLLSISGEDSPNVARKNMKDWTGRLPTRIVMSSNELPHLEDPSGAMASRFIILVLQESFIGREDLELESKLAPEMPAILNWAIEGRRRLLERGRFVQPASGASAVEQMAALSSAVSEFLRECCTVGPEHQAPKDDLYKAWRSWCMANGQRTTDSASFGKDLSSVGIKGARPRVGNERLQVYLGVALTSAPPPPTAPTVQVAPSLQDALKVQDPLRYIASLAPLPPGAIRA